MMMKTMNNGGNPINRLIKKGSFATPFNYVFL